MEPSSSWEMRGGRVKGPISRGLELGSEGLEEIAILGMEVSGWCLQGEEFLEVGRGIAMDTLIGEENDFVFNPIGDREPVKSMQDKHNVFLFLHSHQDPSNAVLDVLESC